MAKKLKQGHACPTCQNLIRATDLHFPFCSDRCRLIDLGKWASGHYRISTPISAGGEFDDESHQGANGKSNGSDDEFFS